MNEIRDLFPGRMRERTFQLKARRDAGAVWHEPQFVECKQCGRRATRTIWTRSLYVCPNCGYHKPIGGYYRLSLVLDHGSFRELDADLAPQDVLHFPGYREKLAAAQNKTGLREAAVTATGRIGGVACVAAVLDSRFFMGSMSTAVGENIEAKYCPSSHYWAKYPELYGGAYGIKPEILDHEVNKFSQCDNTHAREVYGWQPQVDIETGLGRVIEAETRMLAGLEK